MGGEDIPMSGKVLWRPNPLRQTNIDSFRKLVNSKYNLELENYNDLYSWSVEEYDCFWEEFWNFSNIIYSQPYTQVVDKNKKIDDLPEWFHGSRLNYAENLLRYDDDHIAIIAVNEGKNNVVKRSYSELRKSVAQYADILRDIGVKEGDRVAGYLPNCCEAIEAMLATASLGAVWTATSPDIGISGVVEKFIQILPKVIFSVDVVIYNGKTHSHLEKLRQVSKQLPDLERVILIPSSDNKDLHIDIKSVPKCELLPDLLNKKSNPEPLKFAQVPFNHPLFILYSSGTTGIPKCMVHSVGGTLIQHLKEHILHGNMTRSDTLMYFTTTGWMMWNWMASSLAIGSTLVLYDGSPLYPHPAALWDLVDDFGITILGTGATWLTILEKQGIKPKNTHKLTTLHSILSTGSPLSSKSYRYVYRDIKEDVLLGSITGGTDIISCFAGQNPTVPVVEGELQSRNLGMAVESWNEEGEQVWGESGELVCAKPFPSMPVCFWNDPDNLKYKRAYFEKIKGIWCHGDFCQINPITGGLVMLGRSDGTLNPNGVRFGSAEIYNIVQMFKEVQDSLCVSQINKHREERVVLFLRMVPGYSFTSELVEKIRTTIRLELSVRHVPAIILEIEDIPYTSSGKKVEIAVKKIISGENVANKNALSNPESLQLYCNIPELQSFILN